MKSFIHMCLGTAQFILGDTTMRRQAMFYITLGLLLFIAGGLTVGIGWWRQHPITFVLFFIVGLSVAVFLILLALLDMLLVLRRFREQNRLARKELVDDIVQDAENR